MDQSVPKPKTPRRFLKLYFSAEASIPTYENLAAFTKSTDEMCYEALKLYGYPIARRYLQAYQSPDRSVQVRMFFISLKQLLEYREHDHPDDWAKFTSAVESFCGITGASAEIDKILHVLLNKRIKTYENLHLQDDIKTLRRIIPCPTNATTPPPELCELFGYLFTAEIENLMAYPIKYKRKCKFSP